MATKIDPLAVVVMAIVGLIALVLTIANLLIVVPGLGQTESETTEVAVGAEPTRVPPTSLAVALTVVLPATTPTALLPITTSASATLSRTEVIEAARSAAHSQTSGTLQTGQELFEFRCAPCHGLKGEGLIGP
ncbi:MAG TPA: hypothetical protein VHO69_08885, partial [Phototrophicaceae bacterium]|nr:hypothetical protein [Phototrophicaceae bacterium]